MDVKTFALQMYPYWILGILVIIATIMAGYKDVVRIEKAKVIKFIYFLCFLTIYRAIIFRLFSHSTMLLEAKRNISMIPLAITLTVFWEDAVHTLPLYFLKKYSENRKIFKYLYNIALVLVMLTFGVGHLYQGIMASIFLMFYIPYTLKLGEKHGFGTVMICHILFDLTTAASVKYLLGT